MKKYNLIVVISENNKEILMCYRTKEPYKGLYNLIGGKIESPKSLDEAYRELKEETGISNKQITLKQLMNIEYLDNNYKLEVFYGILKEKVTLIEEINKLEWIDIKENFNDMKKFSGEGIIFHIIEKII